MKLVPGKAAWLGLVAIAMLPGGLASAAEPSPPHRLVARAGVVAPTPPVPHTPPSNHSSAPTLAETLPPPEGPMVQVHLTGSPDAALGRRAAGMQTFVRTCFAPCDVPMPIADEYMVWADGFATSPLRLPNDPGGRCTLDVEVPSGWFRLGGIFSVVAGGVVMGAAPFVTSSQGTFWGAEAGGVVLAVAGIVAFVHGSQVDLHVSSDAPPAAPPSLFAPPTVPGSEAPLESPRTMLLIPLVHGTF